MYNNDNINIRSIIQRNKTKKKTVFHLVENITNKQNDIALYNQANNRSAS